MKLVDCVSVSSGHPFRGRIDQFPGTGTRVLQMRDVSVEQGVNWGNIIETELSGKKTPYWIRKSDVLFVARGVKNYAVLIDREMEQLLCAPHFYILRVKKNTLLPEFLVWQLNEKPLQIYFNKSAEGSVTKSVRRSILEEASISIPLLEKQKEILALHKIIVREKALHADLISNSDKLMNTIARELALDKA